MAAEPKVVKYMDSCGKLINPKKNRGNMAKRWKRVEGGVQVLKR